jgi:cyclopropane-fatty-acyl-phospholipid synthase
MTTVVRTGSVLPRVASVGVLERLGKRLCRRALSRLAYGRVELVDGGERHVGGVIGEGPQVRVEVRDPGFYAALAFRGSVGVGESYMEGRWACDDIAGLVELMVVNYDVLVGLEGWISKATAPARRAGYWLKRNTRAGSRRNIAAHYDLSNDFFGLWLDESMTYSSGRFAQPGWTLAEAQAEKIDRACRKLELKPGEHLLEIGTGWGSLAVHAAKAYGCRVTTTTLSARQHDSAVRRVREAGLEDRVRVVMTDYRDLRAPEGEGGEAGYDKLVSIEMIEAVGAAYLRTYFEKCSALLKPSGAMLVQAIVIRDQSYEAAKDRVDFLKAYIFPGSFLPSVRAMGDAVAKGTDMRLWHLEEFGPDYARTLREWRGAFWANIEKVRALGYEETFVRMWHFYLCYCEGVFSAGHTGVVQMLLTKPRWRGGGYAGGVGTQS